MREGSGALAHPLTTEFAAAYGWLGPGLRPPAHPYGRGSALRPEEADKKTIMGGKGGRTWAHPGAAASPPAPLSDLNMTPCRKPVRVGPLGEKTGPGKAIQCML